MLEVKWRENEEGEEEEEVATRAKLSAFNFNQYLVVDLTSLVCNEAFASPYGY